VVCSFHRDTPQGGNVATPTTKHRYPQFIEESLQLCNYLCHTAAVDCSDQGWLGSADQVGTKGYRFGYIAPAPDTT
jgi:hypothetical protein